MSRHDNHPSPLSGQASWGRHDWYEVMKWVATATLDLVFPPACGGCGRVDTLWCSHCTTELNNIPIETITAQPAHFAELAATGHHSGHLQTAIQTFKYYGGRTLSQPLGIRLADCLRQLNWTFDMIVPVPLHHSREAERGYNQSKELCYVIGAELDIPVIPSAIERQRMTRPQVGLNREERRVNVADAFAAHPQSVFNRQILIVDDVYTTGATLSACAQAARHAGATAVYGLTVTVAGQVN